VSLFRISKPASADVARFVAAQSVLPFSYEPVGMTRAEEAPAGWTEDTYRTVLGPGREVFERGKKLVQRWTMFAMPWIELHTTSAPIVVGTTVGVLAHSAGLWCVNAARIVYVIDEKDRYGFAYGTLPGHVEAGEELFLVERTPEDLVAYSIRALSKPRAPLARLAEPWVRREQRRFGADSLVAMRRGVLN